MSAAASARRATEGDRTMAFEIRRPSEKLEEKPRLSRFGRTVVSVAIVAALVVVLAVSAAVQANRARAELAKNVQDAVDRAKVVCANAVTAVGGGSNAADQVATYSRQIDGKRTVDEKAAIAQEMITYTLGIAGSSQSQVDELNGARNRIILALQQYMGAK